MKIPVILGSALLAAGPPLLSAATVRTSGSVRVRYEGLSGQSRPGFKQHDEVASARSIFAAEADAGDWHFVGELTDSRAWLADVDSAISTNEVDALEPTQLYVKLNLESPFGAKTALGLQLGRFAMNIGSRRLVTSDEYRNTANSVAGLRTDLSLPGLTSSLWYVLPATRLPDDIDSLRSNDVQFNRESHHAVLWGGLVTAPHRLVDGALEVIFTRFRESDAPGRPTRDRDLETWGFRWFREPAPGRWDYEFEALRQGGRARTGTGTLAPLRDVAADFEHARIGWTWDARWKPRFAVEYDRATGDRGPEKIRRFDTLLGGRRFDLAPSGLYNQVGRANLDAIGVRLELTPSARSDVMWTWKRLEPESRTDAFSTTGVRDPAGRSGDFAGQQLDLRVRYWVVPRSLRFELDTLILLKARFLEQAPNARPGDTRFVSLNLTWSF